MEESQAMQTRSSQQGCNPILTLGGRVRQGTGITVLAVAAVGTGLVFGWDSLAALGLTTVIVLLLPCLVMCAVGVCASRMGKNEAGMTAGAVPPKDAQLPAAEAVPSAEASEGAELQAPLPGARNMKMARPQ